MEQMRVNAKKENTFGFFDVKSSFDPLFKSLFDEFRITLYTILNGVFIQKIYYSQRDRYFRIMKKKTSQKLPLLISNVSFFTENFSKALS